MLVPVALVGWMLSCGGIMPTFKLHVLLTLVAVPLMWAARWRGWRFFGGAVAAGVAAYALGCWWAWDRLSRHEAMRRRYPLVSLADRLPANAAPPQPDNPDRDGYDDAIGLFGWSRLRARHLQRLHEQAFETFANSPGFGHVRMFRPNLKSIGRFLREGPPPPQPRRQTEEPPADPATPDPGAAGPSTSKLTAGLTEWNVGVRDQFVHPVGFGYVQDLHHVAGFEPHGFQWAADAPPPPLAIDTIELVGLLLAAEPRVYVSDRLPTMKEVRTTPTRPLDAVEKEGLAKLRAGAELHADDPARPRRMVGAVRSVKDRVACHGGGTADLLGAFSYRFAAPTAAKR